MADKTDLEQLRLYLQKLPNVLPVPTTPKYDLRGFAPDPEWVGDIGEEGAVNRELEVIFGSRFHGPLTLDERGPGIEAMSDVLERYLQKYPESVLLGKWVADTTLAAVNAYKQHNAPVSFNGRRPEVVKRTLTFGNFSFPRLQRP